MTEQKKIQITIDPMGNTTVDAQGFNGQGCQDATKVIEQSLQGSGGVTREFKPEFHNMEVAEDQQKLHW